MTYRISSCPFKPEQVMRALYTERYALWMDSAAQEHPESRWSFCMANPIETFEYDGKRLHHLGANQTAIFDEPTPLSTLQNHMEKQRRSIDTHIPFIGGAAGYFGYDLGRTLEVLPEQTERNANIPDMALGIYDQVFAYDHKNNEGWMITHGESDQDVLIKQEAFLERLNNVSNLKPQMQHLSWQPLNTQDEYQKAVQCVIDYIVEGDIFQANLSQRFETDLPEAFDSFSHYLELRQNNPAPFAAYFDIGSVTLASASPERFLQVNADGRVETKPIKGTTPYTGQEAYDKTARETLEASEKDRAENIMIVDLLRNDLSKTCLANSVDVPKLCALERFAHVYHLVSTVTGRLKSGHDAFDLLRGAFPGGSITGAPKIRAMEIIEELESHTRGPYCGSLGYIGFNGVMDTNILIRTQVFEGRKGSFNVGGGIVADSIPESEYQETLDKAAGLFDQQNKEMVAAE